MKNLGNLRIMYADSNEDSLEMIFTLLGFSGIEVIPARSVGDAISLVSTERFDTIMLDSEFPDGSGIDLCRRLRSSPDPIPVIFYSGDAFLADVQKGLAAGAQAYVTKPYCDQLVGAIRSAVSKTRISPAVGMDVKGAPGMMASTNNRFASGVEASGHYGQGWTIFGPLPINQSKPSCGVS